MTDSFPSDGSPAAEPVAILRVDADRGAESGQLEELPKVLRIRLLFICLILVVLAVLAAIFTAVYEVNAAIARPLDLLSYVAEVGVLLGILVILYRGREMPLRHLRRLELLLFGLTTFTVSVGQYNWYHSGWPHDIAREGQEQKVMMMVGDELSSPWLFLIMLYGASIPNTGRRCAAVVLPMMAVALLVVLVLGLQDATLGGYLLRDVLLPKTAVWTGIAAAVAIYGAHRLTGLRKEVQAARQLGQYRLIRKLGAGGMGEVYLAEHLLLRRPCALKRIRGDDAADALTLRRFEREVRTMATLTHWNTVEIFDFGHAEDGSFYYVMEYVPGFTLEQLVKSWGALPPARVVHVLRQACFALREAHAIGLIHRDIKPSNIMVCERGGVADVAKLLDFGLVKRTAEEASNLTAKGFVVGTPLYMSPEQADGLEALDARSDMYSLGAVAYFLLTGRPMFQHLSTLRILAAHISERIVPPSRVQPAVPADLEAVVLRCLEKEKAPRFPDVPALLRALEECGCASDWSQERAAEWWRRHPVPDGPEPAAGTDTQAGRGAPGAATAGRVGAPN